MSEKLYEFIKINDYEMNHFAFSNWNANHISNFYERFKKIMNVKGDSALDLDQFAYFLDRVYENSKDISEYNDADKYPEIYELTRRLFKRGEYRYTFLTQFASDFQDGLIMIKSGGFLVTIFPLSYDGFSAKYCKNEPLNKEDYDKGINELKKYCTFNTNINVKLANHNHGIININSGNFEIIPTSDKLSKETMIKLKNENLRTLYNLKPLVIKYYETRNKVKDALLYYFDNSEELDPRKKAHLLKWINNYFSGDTLPTLNYEMIEILKKALKEIDLPSGTDDIKSNIDAFLKATNTRMFNLNIPPKELDVLYNICTSY